MKEFKTNSKNESEYINMINYLIKTLNDAKSEAIPKKIFNREIFLFEFFVFELYLPHQLGQKIVQPVLAFRFLDFPTLTIEGNMIHGRDTAIFNQGKSSYFEMDVNELREELMNYSMYIMLVDNNYGNMKVLGSSRLNLSIFSNDDYLQYKGNLPQPKRNILKLFNKACEKVAEFDMKLLIRKEYYKYEVNSFPLNQKKFIVQNYNNMQQSNINANKNSISNSLQYSNYHKQRSNDEISKEKTQKENMDNYINKVEHSNVLVQTEKDFSKNISKIYNKSNVQIQTQKINDSNISNNNNKRVSYNNQSKALDDDNNNSPSIIDILNKHQKNPPPLIFHNNIPEESNKDKTSHIIKDEENKNDKAGNIQSDNMRKSYTQKDKNEYSPSNKALYNSKDRKFFFNLKKKTSQESKKEKSAKHRYEDFTSSHPERLSSRVSTSSKRKINLSSYESIKIEEKPNESDNEAEQNENKQLYSKVKNKVMSCQIDQANIIKSHSDKEEQEEERDNNSTNKKLSSNKEKADYSNRKNYQISNYKLEIKKSNNKIESLGKSDNNDIIESKISYGNEIRESINPMQSNTIKQSEIISESIVKSGKKSNDQRNLQIRKQTSAISESLEGYNDFEPSINEKIRKHSSENNDSQIITEENIDKDNSKSIKEEIIISGKAFHSVESKRKETESIPEERFNNYNIKINSNENDTSEIEEEIF